MHEAIQMISFHLIYLNYLIGVAHYVINPGYTQHTSVNMDPNQGNISLQQTALPCPSPVTVHLLEQNRTEHILLLLTLQERNLLTCT